MQLDERRRPRDRHAHRPVRDGLPHADQRARADRPLERARSTSSTCTAPTCASRARSPPTACWPAAWPSAACASSSSSTAAGTSTATCPTQIRGQCRDTDQPSAALITDLKQRGLLDDTLVIWGGEFGRTVYCQGTLTADELRPRPPPALLHHLAGRRRHQARHHLRRDRRLLLQHRRGPGPRPRPATPRSCTASASTTRG